MPRPVIVEGPDGSGKTRFANLISRQTQYEYVRPPAEMLSSTTGPSPTLVDWWLEWAARPQDQLPFVFDRAFYISEPIYTSVMGRKPLCNPMTIAHIQFSFKDAVHVFCNPGADIMASNAKNKDRPQLKGMNNRRRRQIEWLYDMTAFTYHLFCRNTLVYTWANTEYTLEEIERRIYG